MSYKRPTIWFVMDAESIGLRGEAYSVGWVVLENGEEVDSGLVSCSPWAALGVGGSAESADRAWLAMHADDVPATAGGPAGVRTMFWSAWRRWRARGAVMAADVPWPVEARLLSDCIKDQPTDRADEAPYPLVDVASVRLAAGLDPLVSEERLPDELPHHNAQADARQSARLLLEALARIDQRGAATGA